MRIAIDYGRERLEVEVADGALADVQRLPIAPSVPDPAAAVRAALDTPFDFPALRRALTPDDHVAVIVDERLPRLGALLTPILEHLGQAGIEPSAITLVCAPSASKQAWVEDLPEAFEEVQVEIHDPGDRRKLSYLATTKKSEQRIYLNRTVVDADQLVVLTGRGYDAVLGYAGAEGTIYPALSDTATRRKWAGQLKLDAPGPKAWPVRQEATEVAWLLGAPFLVQVIPGAGNHVAHVVGGSLSASAEGQRLLDARWKLAVAEPVPTVVAGVSGDPATHDFADLAQALTVAARVVQPNGRIILLSQAAPQLGEGAELLRQMDDPGKALQALQKQQPADLLAAFQWASAAQQARLFVRSGLANDTVEELFATPLDNAVQVQRLLAEGGSCLFLPDAHRTLAVLAS